MPTEDKKTQIDQRNKRFIPSDIEMLSGTVFTADVIMTNSIITGDSSGIVVSFQPTSGTQLHFPLVSGAITLLSDVSIISQGSGLAIGPVIYTNEVQISGKLAFLSGANVRTSGTSLTVAPSLTTSTLFITDEQGITIPPFNESGVGLHNPIISGQLLMDAAIPYEYYVYKTSGNVTQIRNNSGVTQYSGVDTGLVINHMLSGANSNISIGFQPNWYSGATDIQNNGRKNLRWYGNSAQFGMKIKINSSGDTSRASNNVFESFIMSGSGAGFVFDSVYQPNLSNCRIDGAVEGVSMEASNKWTEFWRLNNVHFNNCVKHLVFKTPTGGLGSYVNGTMDVVTFNQDGTNFPYTFMEVQDAAEISEGVAVNTRWWFSDPSGIGLHMQSGSFQSRFRWFKPYFESFPGTNGDTVGIQIEPSAGAGPYFVGRPIFAGGGGFSHKILNSGNVHTGGLMANWRQSTAVSIPATADTFSASTTVISNANDDFIGIPNTFVVIGGTFAAGETVTVEITCNSLATGGTASTFARTKTYKFTGTYPLEVVDYTTFASNSFRYVIDTITARVKSSVTSSTVTVTITGFSGGGSFQPDPKLSGLTWLGAMNSGANLIAGDATALPATPRGYITIAVSGVNMFMPYYVSG